EKKYTMDVFTPYLSQIRIPGKNDKVYKDECVLSFDNPETDTGLYVSLSSFLGFGKEYVKDYYLKSGYGVFLHIRREKHEGDGPEKKITRLAIGVEGGFDPDTGKKYEYVDYFNVVVMPNFTAFQWPNTNLPEVVKHSVTAILEIQSAATLEEIESLSGTW
ncbi:hypothetical protein AMK59_5753, partial [Oryctes borbonicus]